jgi:thymidylate synthase (FAD)
MKTRSDIKVVFDDSSNKGDRGVALRAWALHPDLTPEGKQDDPAGWRRLIRALMKGRHGTPLEGGYLSVFVEAPVVVWWEWTRHRFMSLGCPDLGFNLESGRYKVLEGEFYIPPEGRPCKEPDGFKPMKPVLEDDVKFQEYAGMKLSDAYSACWSSYDRMVDNGVAREVARLALPFGTYYSGYVSANPRTWLQFFSLRKNDPDAQVKSYPQWEIEQADVLVEAMFAERWPITYSEFCEQGRVAV